MDSAHINPDFNKLRRNSIEIPSLPLKIIKNQLLYDRIGEKMAHFIEIILTAGFGCLFILQTKVRQICVSKHYNRPVDEKIVYN
jgi:hypothetical protein